MHEDWPIKQHTRRTVVDGIVSLLRTHDGFSFAMINRFTILSCRI